MASQKVEKGDESDDQQCVISNDIHLSEIARKIECWEDLAPYLKIEEQEIYAIQQDNKNNYNQQKTDFLRRWRAIYGDSATYYCLIQTAKSCGMDKLAFYINSLLGR